MPPLIAAVTAVVSAIGSFTIGGFAVGSFALNLAVSVGLSFVAKALAPKPKNKGQAPGTGSTLVTIRDPLAARRVVYGRTRIAGTIVYLTSTSNSTYLHLVVALCQGPVDEIETIYLNDEAVTLDGNGYVTDGTYAGTYARIQKFLGGTSQAAASDLIAESGGAWTAAHQLKGIAYLYCRFTWNQNVWSTGLPNITAVVRGRSLYDPRSSTSAWSQNAALVIRDFLTLTPAQGGVGATSAEIDETSFSAAANICDETVSLSAGGTETRYTASGVLELGDGSTPQEVMQSLLTSCGGKLSFYGGKWRLVVAAWRSPTFTLTDSSLRGPLRVETRISRRDQFNAIKGSYPSPADRYVSKDYPAITSSTFEAQDGGTRVYRDSDFSWTTSSSMAQRLAKIELYRSRLPVTVQAQSNLTAYAVTVGDVIYVTHARWGWTNKTFEVVGVSWAIQDHALGIDLTLRETNANVFDWSATEEQLVAASPKTSFPNWTDIDAPSIALSAGNAELLVLGDGTVASRIKVSFLPGGSAFADRWEIRWKLSADSVWTDPVSIGASGSNVFWISPVIDSASYDVEARAVTSLGGRSDWGGVYGFLVAGKSLPPDDVDGLTLVDTVLKWDYLPPSDFAGFQVRYQQGTNLYWSTAVPAHSGLLTAGQLDVATLLGGTKTFLVKAVDTSGNESDNAAWLTTTASGVVTIGTVAYTADYKALGFPGTITTGSIDGGTGDLVGASGGLWWAANDSTPLWPTGQSLFWPPSGSYGDIVWSTTFQPNSFYAPAGLSILTAIGGASWSISYRIDGAGPWWQSSDSSLFWPDADSSPWWDAAGAFQPWPGRLANAPMARYEFLVEVQGGPVQPDISQFTFQLDVADVTETVANLAVGASGTRLPLTKTFRAIRIVTLTVQSDGGSAVTARAEDKSASGPLVVCFDPTGTQVAGTVDAIVQGI